ncbi:MAG: dienelactone hydrolase family protein [bacterium]|nr:dienelactone hydrolase family protein [Gammaproteobacteria bacterium]HIL95237.1 dienelactone hydrolase family protein [Pseudomonadales bacterium]
MGEIIQLNAKDGFQLDAYLAKPSTTAKGAVLVIQEIFGVNGHIREVCDGYAENGYVAISPAIFDRAEKGVELGYDDEGIARGAGLARKQLQPEQTDLDLAAAADYLGQYGDVGVVGYCFGGFLAWKCACQLDGIKCVSGYYGGGIAGSLDLVPKVPTILHFGNLDAHIPLSDVDKVAEAHPEVAIYIYEADHGFNCDHRASFDKPASEFALQRTLTFFGDHLN